MKRSLSFSTDYGSRIYGVARCIAMVSLMVGFIPVQAAFALFMPTQSYRGSRIFYRLALRILGFQVRTHGTVTDANPTLFVANHVSYLDVPVLGVLIPAMFVAKSEVAHWPLIGFLCKLHNTVFIERRRTRASQQRDMLHEHLARGKNLVLFPEGTSSDGLYALPFKSSLFGTVEADVKNLAVTIQPVSIVCTAIDGLPIPRAWRPYYAWFGDMTFVGHFWNVLKCGRFTVDVTFHPSIAANSMSRKQLASACHEAVARGIEQCLIGRTFRQMPVTAKLPAGVSTHI